MLHPWKWSEPSWIEPSLAEALSDPVVRAMMAADAVDPQALGALLREVARKIEFSLPPARPAGLQAMPIGARH